MISVKVTYTVKPEFVAQNKANIKIFLEDFNKLNASDFEYDVFLCQDGITFLHLSSYKNEEIQNQILNVPSFKNFQKERDESGLNNSHTLEMLEHIGSSK
ncbi:hypothetical protein ACI6PS_05085 [Flavobacterium sp. PLA-1-15]|uniref:hypothetical protein n=1 Tax=Flavobacterium sp. PLA-1-15 TaxID=3380533 RepID=UPI003B818E89